MSVYMYICTFVWKGSTHTVQYTSVCITQRDEWTMKSPMSTRRSALSIAVLGKDIYVIGGYDGNTSLSSVEM